MPCNPQDLHLRQDWVLTRNARERVLARRHQLKGDQWADKTRELGVLLPGQVVQIQNQTGPHAKKWDISGSVVENLGYDSYLVKLDGSGRVSRRNRRFLRPINSYKSVLEGSVRAGPKLEGSKDTLEGSKDTLEGASQQKLGNKSCNFNPNKSDGLGRQGDPNLYNSIGLGLPESCYPSSSRVAYSTHADKILTSSCL